MTSRGVPAEVPATASGAGAGSYCLSYTARAVLSGCSIELVSVCSIEKMPAISSKPPKAGARGAFGTAEALASSAPRPFALGAGWGVARPSGVMPVLRQSARASAMSVPHPSHMS